jgi:hypothetical protein
MRIKVTSLVILHQIERHGLRKKYESKRIREQKALVFKERERERRESSDAPPSKRS